MTWNYRILAHKERGGIYFQIHEVYYTSEEIAIDYAKAPIDVISRDLKGINNQLEEIKKATNKPILWAGVLFPKEYLDLPKYDSSKIDYNSF